MALEFRQRISLGYLIDSIALIGRAGANRACLGLSIAKWAVDAHGRSIVVQCDLNKGFPIPNHLAASGDTLRGAKPGTPVPLPKHI